MQSLTIPNISHVMADISTCPVHTGIRNFLYIVSFAYS